MLAIKLPPKLLAYKEQAETLRKNSELLTSHFDLHSTFQHITTFPHENPDMTAHKRNIGRSLFTDIAKVGLSKSSPWGFFRFILADSINPPYLYCLTDSYPEPNYCVIFFLRIDCRWGGLILQNKIFLFLFLFSLQRRSWEKLLDDLGRENVYTDQQSTASICNSDGAPWHVFPRSTTRVLERFVEGVNYTQKRVRNSSILHWFSFLTLKIVSDFSIFLKFEWFRVIPPSRLNMGVSATPGMKNFSDTLDLPTHYCWFLNKSVNIFSYINIHFCTSRIIWKCYNGVVLQYLNDKNVLMRNEKKIFYRIW